MSSNHVWGSQFWDQNAQQFTDYYFPIASKQPTVNAPSAPSASRSSLPAGIFDLPSPAVSGTANVAAPPVASKYGTTPVAENGCYSIKDFTKILGQHLIEHVFPSSSSTRGHGSMMNQSDNSASVVAPVCPPLLLQQILSATLDVEINPTTPMQYIVGKNGMVTRAKWMEFLKRFGPFPSLYNKVRACCGIDGKHADWFRADQTRDSVDNFIRAQGAEFTCLLRYKLAAGDEQVFSLSLANGQHYQVFHKSDGYMYLGSGTARFFPTVRELIFSVHEELHAVDNNWGNLAKSIEWSECEWSMVHECVKHWIEDGRDKSSTATQSSSASSDSNNLSSTFLARHWSTLSLSTLRHHHPSVSIHTEFTKAIQAVEANRKVFRHVVEARMKHAHHKQQAASNTVTAAGKPAASAPISTIQRDYNIVSNRVFGVLESHWSRLLSQLLEWLESDCRRIMDTLSSGSNDSIDSIEGDASAILASVGGNGVAGARAALFRRHSMLAHPNLAQRQAQDTSAVTLVSPASSASSSVTPHAYATHSLDDSSVGLHTHRHKSLHQIPEDSSVSLAERERMLHEERGTHEWSELERKEMEANKGSSSGTTGTEAKRLQEVEAQSHAEQHDLMVHKTWLVRSKTIDATNAAHLNSPEPAAHASSARFFSKQRLHVCLGAFDNVQLLKLIELLRDELSKDLHEATRYFSVLFNRMQMQPSAPIEYDVARLRKWEWNLYVSLTKILHVFEIAPSRQVESLVANPDDLLWNRFFDAEETKIPIARFAQALRIAALQEHWFKVHATLQTAVQNTASTLNPSTPAVTGSNGPQQAAFDSSLLRPKVPSASILQKILTVTADTEGNESSYVSPVATASTSDGYISYSEWVGFLGRYGPFASSIQKARSVCTASGGKAVWFHPTATMTQADAILSQQRSSGSSNNHDSNNHVGTTPSGLRFLVRLGRTPPSRAFVLVVARDEHSAPIHIYISNSNLTKQGLHIESSSATADVKYHSDFFDLLIAVCRELFTQSRSNDWASEISKLEQERDSFFDVRHAHPLKLVATNDSSAAIGSHASSLLLRPSDMQCAVCKHHASLQPSDTLRFYSCVRGCAYVLCSSCLQNWKYQDVKHTVGVNTAEMNKDISISHPASYHTHERGAAISAQQFHSSIDTAVASAAKAVSVGAAAAAHAHSDHHTASCLTIHPASIRAVDTMLDLTNEFHQSSFASRSLAEAFVTIYKWLQIKQDPPPLLSMPNLSIGDISRYRLGGFSLMHCMIDNALNCVNDSWTKQIVDLAKAGVPVHIKATGTSSLHGGASFSSSTVASDDGADTETVEELAAFDYLDKHKASLVGVRPVVLAVMLVRAISLPNPITGKHTQQLAQQLSNRRNTCLELVRCFLRYPLGIGVGGVEKEEYAAVMMELLRESVRSGMDRISQLILEPFQVMPAGSALTSKRSTSNTDNPGSSSSASATGASPSPAEVEQELARSTFLELLHSTTSNDIASREIGTVGTISGALSQEAKKSESNEKGSFLHFMATCSSSSFRTYMQRLITSSSNSANQANTSQLLLQPMIDEEVRRAESAISLVLEELLLTFKGRRSKLSYLSAKSSFHHSATYLSALHRNLTLFDALIFHPDFRLSVNQSSILLHAICRVWSAEDLSQRLDALNQRGIVTQVAPFLPAHQTNSTSHSAIPASAVLHHPAAFRSLSSPILRHSKPSPSPSPMPRASIIAVPSLSVIGASPLDDEWDLAIKLNALNAHGQTALELLVYDLYPAATGSIATLQESNLTLPSSAAASETSNGANDRETAAASERKRGMLLFLIERGAKLPTDLNKSQLLHLSTLLFTAMRAAPHLRYRIPERAVKNGDVPLFSLIFKPLLDRQSTVAPMVEYFNADNKKFESLLLLACHVDMCVDEDGVEQRNAQIVEILLNYKPMPTAMAVGLHADGNSPMPSASSSSSTSSNAGRRDSLRSPFESSPATLEVPFASDRINFNLEDAATKRNALHLIIGGVADLQSMKNCTAITELLLNTRQFDLMASDYEGCNVLHLAAKNNLIQVTDALIREHIALDARTLCRTHGMSALHIASEQGNWQIVISLLQAGAAVDLLDGSGETALTKAMIAQRTLEAEIQRRLVEEEEDDGEQVEQDDEAPSPISPLGALPTALSERLSDATLHQLLVRYQRTSAELLKAGAGIHESCEHSQHTVECLVNINVEFLKIHKKMQRFEEQEENDHIKGSTATDAKKVEDEDDDEDDEDELSDDDNDEDVSASSSDADSLFSQKLTQIVMNELYEQHVISKHIARLIRFLVTLILLTFVCVYSNTQDKKSAYFLTQSLQNRLADDAFNGMNNAGDFWTWSRSTLQETIYADMPPSVANSTTDETLILGQNHLIGLVRLRQVRSTAGCISNPLSSVKSSSCPHEAAATIGPGITELYPTGPLDTFQFHTQSELHGASWSGQYDVYDGSGYVVTLPPLASDNAAKNSLALMNHLESIGWIDTFTRAVFVEFTLFNSQENHFVVVTMLVELPPTGSVIATSDFSIHRLVRYITLGDHVLLFFQILLLVLLFAYFFTEAQELVGQGLLKYLSSFYNTMDIAMFVLTLTIVYLQLYAMNLSRQLDWGTQEQFVPVQAIASALWYHSQLSSILVFISWLKAIEFFSVFKDISRLTVMIEMVAIKLVPFFVVLLISLFAFASAESIAYGYKDSSLFTWSYSLLSRMTQTFSYDSNLADFQFMRSFYSIMFAVSICLIMLNLVVAILNSAYEDALQDSGDSYWARKQYGMICNALHKKKTGTFTQYDQQLERLVGYVSSLEFNLPFWPSVASSEADSRNSKKKLHLTLADLDESDESTTPGQVTTDASAPSTSSVARARRRKAAAAARLRRIHSISTAPAWLSIVPSTCKHASKDSADKSIQLSRAASRVATSSDHTATEAQAKSKQA